LGIGLQWDANHFQLAMLEVLQVLNADKADF